MLFIMIVVMQTANYKHNNFKLMEALKMNFRKSIALMCAAAIGVTAAVAGYGVNEAEANREERSFNSCKRKNT